MPKTHKRIPRASASCRLAGAALASLVLAWPGASVLAAEGKAEAGATKNSMCTGCHGIPGYKASFPRVYSVPRISGQSAKYIENALAAYKKGDRSHPTMRAIAASLSEQDMADLAAYYAGR